MNPRNDNANNKMVNAKRMGGKKPRFEETLEEGRDHTMINAVNTKTARRDSELRLNWISLIAKNRISVESRSVNSLLSGSDSRVPSGAALGSRSSGMSHL